MNIVDCRTAKRTKLHEIDCHECGKTFYAYRNTRITCSKECKANYIRHKERVGAFVKCQKCGEPFWSSASQTLRSSGQRFCSMICRRKDSTVPIGRYISYDGYWIISKGRKQVREHRIIYEQQFGKIPAGYIVHHKNGDKLDNRVENLEAVSRSEHNRIHGFSPNKRRKGHEKAKQQQEAV